MLVGKCLCCDAAHLRKRQDPCGGQMSGFQLFVLITAERCVEVLRLQLLIGWLGLTTCYK